MLHFEALEIPQKLLQFASIYNDVTTSSSHTSFTDKTFIHIMKTARQRERENETTQRVSRYFWADVYRDVDISPACLAYF